MHNNNIYNINKQHIAKYRTESKSEWRRLLLKMFFLSSDQKDLEKLFETSLSNINL